MPRDNSVTFSFIAVPGAVIYLIQYCIAEVVFFVYVCTGKEYVAHSGMDINIKNSDCVVKYVLIHFYCMRILPECLK